MAKGGFFYNWGDIRVFHRIWYDRCNKGCMIVIGSINNGERVRSKVRGIGVSGELDFRDSIRESTYGRVGRVKEDQ